MEIELAVVIFCPSRIGRKKAKPSQRIRQRNSEHFESLDSYVWQDNPKIRFIQTKLYKKKPAYCQTQLSTFWTLDPHFWQDMRTIHKGFIRPKFYNLEDFQTRVCNIVVLLWKPQFYKKHWLLIYILLQHCAFAQKCFSEMVISLWYIQIRSHSHDWFLAILGLQEPIRNSMFFKETGISRFCLDKREILGHLIHAHLLHVAI